MRLTWNRDSTLSVRLSLTEAAKRTRAGGIVLQETRPVDLNPDGGSVLGFDIIDVSRATAADGEFGVQLTFEIAWTGCGPMEVLETNVELDGSEIHLDVLAFQPGPLCDAAGIQQHVVNVGALEPDDYGVRAVLSEILTDANAASEEAFLVEAKFIVEGDGAHVVQVQPGQVVNGIDFGNTRIANNGLEPDSKLGTDPHSGDVGPDATPAKFEGNRLRVSSFIDADDDRDVFQFEGDGSFVFGEGGTVSGEIAAAFELLDGEGNVLSKSLGGGPLEVQTVAGATYFIRVSGAHGEHYVLDLFREPADEPSSVAPPLDGDTDLDGDVDFKDFLLLSANFGKEVDEAFAAADFDVSGSVDFGDFLLLAANYGRKIPVVPA